MWPRSVKLKSLIAASCLLSLASLQAQPLGLNALRLTQELSTLPKERVTAPRSAGAADLSLQGCGQALSHEVSMLMPPIEGLSLGDVLARLLCQSPAMAQSLAAIREQVAGVDLANLAWRPRYSAQLEARLSQSPATAESFALQTRLVTAGVAINWVMFDFGLRDSNLAQARALLQVAIANQSSTVLAQIAEGVRMYAEAQNAWIRLGGQREALAVAEQSFAVAQARYEVKVGALAEKLQAQTALAQAQLDTTRAQSNWLSARTSLAIALAWDAQQEFSLLSVQEAFTLSPPQDDWAVLRELAHQQHPRLRSLNAEIVALQQRIAVLSAESQGSVSLIGNTNLTQGLGGSSGRELLRNASVGVIANIPLGNNVETKTRQAQVHAQIQSRLAQQQALKRELDTELWRSHQQIKAEQSNLDAVEPLLAAAEQNYKVAQGRYQAGVGSMLEVLSAQSARTQAIIQGGNAWIAYGQAQMRLILALGHLGSISGIKANNPAQNHASGEFKKQ